MVSGWRVFECVRCKAMHLVCSSCDRRYRYCSQACSKQGRAWSQREAGRKFVQTPAGRAGAARRQREYRRRKKEAKRKAELQKRGVTHHGSQADLEIREQPAFLDAVSSVPSAAEETFPVAQLSGDLSVFPASHGHPIVVSSPSNAPPPETSPAPPATRSSAQVGAPKLCCHFCGRLCEVDEAEVSLSLQDIPAMSRKHTLLISERTRHLPREGWSWIDRRFTREWIGLLSRDATLLYFFLAAVSDKNGLSYYADDTIASRLHVDVASVVTARSDLMAFDLVAFRSPLYQVLSLPQGSPQDSTARQSTARAPRGSVRALREIFEGFDK